MFENLRGKKLLVLGSTYLLAEIVDKAHEMGVYVGVVDYNDPKSSPAKVVADAHFEISLAETEKIATLVKNENYDGVLTGFTDSYLGFYDEICRLANKPCYGHTEHFRYAADKEAFKKWCKSNNVPVIPGGTATCLEEASELAVKIGFPLILKPVDNSGSRGVVKCEKEGDLFDSFQYAFSYSATGRVIVEKYMDVPCFGVSYFMVDGEAYLTSTCDRRQYTCIETGSSIAGALRYPSAYDESYERVLDERVKTMLRGSGIKDGMLSFQAFCDAGSFYFCEMCFRPSGGHHYVFIEDQTGQDELGMLIEYALTGRIDTFDPDKVNPHYNDECVVAKVLGEPGVEIASVTGLDLIESDSRIKFISKGVGPGQMIGPCATTAQTLLTIWYVRSRGQKPGEIEKYINSNFRVVDSSGQPVPYEVIDWDDPDE